MKPYTDFLNENIPILRPYISLDALDSIDKVFKSGWVGEGVETNKLEKELLKITGFDYAVAVNSGTSSIELFLDICNLDHNSTVVTTSFTCSASIIPYLRKGIKVKFIDIDDQGSLSITELRRLLQKDESIDLVMGIDLHGIPCKHNEIYEIVREYGALYVVDGAQSLGALINGKKFHKYMDFYFTSFQSVKTLTAIDGGCLFFNDSKFQDPALRNKWFGIKRKEKHTSKMPWKYDTDILGAKLHMNDVLASIALTNMNDFNEIVIHQQMIADIYNSYILDHPLITKIKVDKFLKPTYWLYPILINKDREIVIEMLQNEKIEAHPVHQDTRNLTSFRNTGLIHSEGLLLQTSIFEKKLLCLPTGWWVSEKKAIHIAKVLNKILDDIK